MKTIIPTSIEGVYIIENFNAFDDRGLFVKTFNTDFLNQKGIDFQINESYYSISNKNVIRGMHFQLPPDDHQKLVYVISGSVIDVVLDLRKESKTYKQYISIELSDKNHKSVYIPKGLAHGFKSLENNTIMMYNVGTTYNPTSDAGIHYNSFGFNWDLEKPILSTRDLSFPTLDDFSTINPF
ncbi:dTDP-4-dehydrorhamnose 3,5-epimerase family protein [Capnocytophaga sputigena]|jgi:dTDP-4-dehydrorhamnose 3,5-epimerase|uniref:dTDP-4-dehydrorhamnose 3,5-epimerase n=1 Tax=Capnocytophaga sputigena TaxID=1019 RepID=A0AAX2ICN4_CAPSP|nr:dTDP-4-dehydrorhamnose 3,5-epimerase family protein [Capnocytophaga sputigena]ATA84873.1 dTDP-4-keto-6-deoxy-D-glucose epimerase [Capnocytophaga sputigena]EEB66248.1 putative dTDP-4-dehydrorhamnose 3,5-epimerase [Capnocytophaga sputigena ATCC 33612]SQA76160.1 dTDP-4-dehydrorhamnose 3,5-epimerase [Capnocytophaga sputigena]